MASPANPTGTVLPPARLRALAEACSARGITFISDEIYHGITLEAAEPARTVCPRSDALLPGDVVRHGGGGIAARAAACRRSAPSE